MNDTQRIITVAVIALATAITRFLPFIVFPEGKKVPAVIMRLGKILPYAIIGLLVVYCLKDAVFTSFHALPELISIAVVVLLQKWKKNMYLSMISGTVLYMVLVQLVFKG
ncbi:MAG: AzlD domain-containing protein [Clostridia bacterium]|nr:AzlD domain-containing protein [Clostridia bacterium]